MPHSHTTPDCRSETRRSVLRPSCAGTQQSPQAHKSTFEPSLQKNGANCDLCVSELERAFTRPGQTHSETGGCKMKQAHKSTFEPSSRKNGAICDLCARGQERTCARPGQTRQQAADLGAKRAHNPGSSPPPALPWRKSRLVCPGQRVAEICYPHRYLSHLPIGPECPHCEKSQTTAAISAARSIDSKQSRHGETTAEPR